MPYALWPWVNFSGHFSMSLYISPSTPLSAADAAHAAQGIFAYAGDLVISLNPFASDSSADGAASSTGTAVTVMANDQPSIFDQEFKRFEQKHGAPAQPAAPAQSAPSYHSEPAHPKDVYPWDDAAPREPAPSEAVPARTAHGSTGFGFDQPLMAGDVNVGILFSEPSLILALAIIIEMIIPLPRSIRLYGLLPVFTGLSRKVNRPGRSETQRSFAGFMLPVIILLTLLFLVFTLDAFSGFDSIISLVVMILVLELKFPQDRTIDVYRALHEGFKEKSRDLLSTMVLRETGMLSPMGISKAACEAAIMRIFTGWFAVIVWYFIGGIEAAVLMQTINIMSHAFNYKLRGNHAFGSTVYRMHQIMIFIPAVVLMAFLFFSRNPVRHLAGAAEGMKTFPAPVTGMVLGAVGASLNISLSGPRYYQGVVLRLPKLGGEHNPDEQSMLHAMRKIRMCGLLLLVVSILIGLNF